MLRSLLLLLPAIISLIRVAVHCGFTDEFIFEFSSIQLAYTEHAGHRGMLIYSPDCLRSFNHDRPPPRIARKAILATVYGNRVIGHVTVIPVLPQGVM